MRRLFLLTVLAALGPSGAAGQSLPAGPVTVADGRVALGVDFTATASSNDDEPAWFNYTAYEHNVLRLARLGVAADTQLTRQVSVLGQVVLENRNRPRLHALYVRMRPWADRPFDVQIGRIPPTFGAFSRRTYAIGSANPVIGYPLAYQYLTSLRADAVPESADDLLANRAEGWRPIFPIGSGARDTGVPLMTAFEWDTGLQGRLAWRTLDASAAVTTGTLSEPRVRDNNGGKQVAGRLTWRPAPAIAAGMSAARGEYVAEAVRRLVPAGTPRRALSQRAWGVDIEYSRGHTVMRAEAIVSDWRLPAFAAPRIEDRLRAWSISTEGRYAFWPGVFAGGRYDYLGFSTLQGTGTRLAWDAPVARVEIGGGYYLQRNLVGKITYQHNWREAGIRRLGIWSAQAQYWF